MLEITKFFMKNKKFTFVLSIFLVVFGMGALSKLNSESFPSVNMATAVITTNYDGASPEDIETKITKPLEDEIRGVIGIKDVKSNSQAGLSSIVVRIDIDNADVVKSMADLQKAIDRVTDLPPDLRDPPSFIEIKSEEFPVMEIALVGDNTNRQRDRIADLFKEEIEDNKSVLKVNYSGFNEREFKIQLRPERLKELHIGVTEIINKIKSRNVNVPGGHLKDSKFQQLLRLEGKIKSAKDIENIVIRSNFSGERVLLKDVATIIDGYKDQSVIAHYNGDEATILIVTKKGGADTLAMVEDLNKKLEKFRNTYQENYKFHVYHNEGDKVLSRLNILASNAVSGLILVIVFLLIFLPGKIGLMASLSLPLAIMGTIGFMPIFGMNLNTITILALVIALGMLVDNSVVISENYARLRHNGIAAFDAAFLSIKSLWMPITATAFTTIAAFLPMLVTKGIMGQFIMFIPILVTISLVMSLAESFFLLPMRLVAIDAITISSGTKLKKKEPKKRDWFHTTILPNFGKLMEWLLAHRYKTLLIYLGMLVGSILMMTVGNKMDLFPADQTEMYVGRMEMPKGTKLVDSDQALVVATKMVMESKYGKHIDHIVTRSGVQRSGPTDPKGKTGDYVGLLSIYVNDFAKNNLRSTDLISEFNTLKVPGTKEIAFEAVINGPPVGDPVNATFRSNNKKSLNNLIKEVTTQLAAVPGIRDVKVNDVTGDDEIYIDINYDKADRLNLDVNAIGQTVRSAISGKVISDVTLDNKKVDLQLKLDAKSRKNISDLMALKVMDSQGNLIPLSQLATFRRETGSQEIKRYDYKRSKTVTANVNVDAITAIEANDKLNSIFLSLQSEFPDVSIAFGGEAESTNESMSSLFDALILSLIGIFALLVFIFNSFLRPAIIMSTIPLGLVGFSIAFAGHGRPISFLALIGIIGLGGIIVNSGIVLISFIEELKIAEPDTELSSILVKASQLRLRAVVVSSLTTISGLFPTAYSIGGSDAMLVPMTLAMFWGLTSGTVLTLMWVPCFYAILEDMTAWVTKIVKKTKLGHISVNTEDKGQASLETTTAESKV